MVGVMVGVVSMRLWLDLMGGVGGIGGVGVLEWLLHGVELEVKLGVGVGIDLDRVKVATSIGDGVRDGMVVGFRNDDGGGLVVVRDCVFLCSIVILSTNASSSSTFSALA